jgi:hypothetical protein
VNAGIVPTNTPQPTPCEYFAVQEALYNTIFHLCISRYQSRDSVPSPQPGFCAHMWPQALTCQVCWSVWLVFGRSPVWISAGAPVVVKDVLWLCSVVPLYLNSPRPPSPNLLQFTVHKHGSRPLDAKVKFLVILPQNLVHWKNRVTYCRRVLLQLPVLCSYICRYQTDSCIYRIIVWDCVTCIWSFK